jgi:succinate dehydrogenase/fumarate reductase flavoprotein subunit
MHKIQSLSHPKGEDPSKTIKNIRELSWQTIGVVRNAKGLNQAIRDFQKLQQIKFQIKDTPGLIKSLEVKNLALTGYMVAKSALERKESRGHHTREDFPDKDDSSWRKTINITKGH